jgi:hypothetical protein
MTKERMQILRMLEEGKINSEEAFQLMNTLEDTKPAASSTQRQHLRVRVIDGKDTKVNINIPLQLAKFAMRFIPKQVMEEHPELDIDTLLQEIQQGTEGKLVEVEDGETHVEIYVE